MRPTRALPAIAAAAATALLLAGCAAGDTPPTSKAKSLDLAYTSPERKGAVDEVTWLLAGEPAGFDTDRAGGSNEDTVVANVCERLFQQQPDLTIEPWLAESYRQPDDTTLVLRIRDGVVFHDGSRLDAADVVYSLERHAADGNEESDEFSNVRSISRTGAREVTLKLKQPDSQLIGALAADAGIVQDRQTTERQGEEYGTPGSADACSGPYQIAEWKPGTSLTLTRFDKHWSQDLKGGPKRVVFTWAESAAAVNTLTAGEADGTYLSSPALVPALAKSKRLRTYFGPSTMVYSLVPTSRGGMKSPHLRRALSLALDRAGIAKAGFQEYALPARLPVGPAAWGYAKESFEAAYQQVKDTPAKPDADALKQAKDLVAKADASGKEIIVASDGSPYRTVIANAVKAAGEQIGLQVKITTLSESAFDEFYGDESARAAVDLVPVGWYISKADPVGFYDNMVSGGANNWIDYSSEAYDAAIADAAATSDPEARAASVIKAQREFMAQMLWIPVVQAPNTLVLSRELTGPPASVGYLYHPWLSRLGAAG